MEEAQEEKDPTNADTLEPPASLTSSVATPLASTSEQQILPTHLNEVSSVVAASAATESTNTATPDDQPSIEQETVSTKTVDSSEIGITTQSASKASRLLYCSSASRTLDK